MKFVKYNYALLQSAFWMTFAVGYGFVTLYLKTNGFSASEIGMLIALFGALSAVIQPFVGKIADKGLGWKPILLALLFLTAADVLLMLLIPSKTFQGIGYGLFIMLAGCMMPMVNAANFYYESRGVKMQFGICRGCGSLMYAVVCYILGGLTESGNVLPVLYAALIITALFIFVTLLFPYGKKAGEVIHTASSRYSLRHSSDENIGIMDFVKKNKLFCLVLLGFVGAFMAHNMAGTYLLQIVENLGGTSADMGTINSVMAIVELPVMFGFAFIHKKISTNRLMAISAVAFVVKTLSYLLSTKVFHLYMAQFFQIFGFAVFSSVSVFFANEVASEGDKIKAQSFVTMAITLGQVFGNLLGGLVVDSYGAKGMLLLALLLSAAGAATAILGIISLSKKAKAVV
ncbi:MAG: MFS transporter [Lachnospiraceae bacterium]|nr:MFS transporter [Lachnospiraceae bacterium]